MSVGVVHELELVDIHVQQGDQGLRVFLCENQGVEAVLQLTPIRQVGQWIVTREMPDLALSLFDLRQVVEDCGHVQFH